MRKTGTIIRWEKERAFGFIRSPDTVAEVFFHLRDYLGPQPIQIGQPVEFDEIVVGGQGPRALTVREPMTEPQFGPVAMSVANTRGDLLPRDRAAIRREPARARAAGPREPGWLVPAVLGLMLAWAVGWAAAVALDRVGWVWLAALAVLNIATFFAYWYDKTAAEQGDWRTQEELLHALALAGGWPGAWCAQRTFRHKTRKVPFQRAFWGTVVLHGLCLGLLLAGVITLGD